MDFSRRLHERCSFKSQLEKSSKANNEGTTPRKLQTAIQSIFKIKKSTAEFLKLFSELWVISNSKTAYNTNNCLGNAAVNSGQKLSFLRAMAEWVQTWQTEKIPKCKNFTLTAQSSSVLVRIFFVLHRLLKIYLEKENMILY